MAVEGGAQLPAEPLGGQAQRLPGRGQSIDELLAPERHVVEDLGDTGDALQTLAELECGGLQACRILAGQADREIAPGRAGTARGDHQALQPGRHPNRAAPGGEEFLVAHLALLRRHQLHQNGRKLIAGRPGAGLHRHRAAQSRHCRIDQPVTHRRLGVAQRALHLGEERRALLARGAGDEGGVGEDDLRLG